MCGEIVYQRVRNRPYGARVTALEVPAVDTNNAGDIYLRYLRAMMSIGLGEEAMSYTKFNRFAQAERDFHRRLGRSFAQLKRERAGSGAPSRVSSPKSISACVHADFDLVVCDDVKQTWLYVR